MKSDHEAGVEFEVLAPVVSAMDLDRSLEFYRDVLGFQIDWTWGSPPEMAAVSRDGVEIHLSADGDSSRGTRSRIYCFIRGVDRFAANVRKRGGTIVNDVADQPYGMREFDLDDPAGNRLCFGEPTVD